MGFGGNYHDMRSANTIGADKYFHCKANCEAAQRGSGGDSAACTISDTREFFDQWVKGDPAAASADDQSANRAGRSGGTLDPSPCEILCGGLRPPGLSQQY